MVPWQMLSPPLDFESKSLGVGTHPPFNEAELHAASVPIWGNQSKSFTAGSFIEPLTQPVISSVYTSKGTQNSVRKAPISYADIQAPKRSRSPTLHSSNDTPLEDATALYNSQRYGNAEEINVILCRSWNLLPAGLALVGRHLMGEDIPDKVKMWATLRSFLLGYVREFATWGLKLTSQA